MEKKKPLKVPSLEMLRKLIKQEKLINGRLQSLRLPRDLSLGGTKPKKVFTPNLNVIRSKDKNKHVPIKIERGQKRNRDHFSPTGASSRGKHKQMKYIQCEGVFSQGMGELKRPTYHSRGGGTNEREYSDATAALVMPRIDVHSWNINKNEDAEVIKDLVANEESNSESETEYDPIALPLHVNTTSFIDAHKIKEEDALLNIKKEYPDKPSDIQVPVYKMNGSYELDLKPKIKLENPQLKIEQRSSFTDDNKYDEDNPSFSIMQLPSTFSGKLWSDDPDDKNLDYTLAHVPEGQIGKIIIRKSGKMEATIKNTKYVVTAADSGCVVETAHLFPGEESVALEPSLVTMGNISERFMLTPHWDTLFDRAKKNNKFYW